MKVASYLLSSSKSKIPPERSLTKDPKISLSDALTQFDNMLHTQPPPPISSFNPLLITVAKGKMYQDLIFMCNRMAEANLLPDFVGMNVLLNCYCALKSAGLGFAVMGGMLKRGYDPNIVTFTTLIKGLCMEGKIGDALDLLKKIVRMGFRPNVKTRETLVIGLCKTGNIKVALRMHQELGNETEFEPSVIYYCCLIVAFAKRGWWKKVKNYF